MIFCSDVYEVSKTTKESIWKSETDLEQASGQLNSSEDTNRHCKIANTGRNLISCYAYKKSSIDVQKTFQDETNQSSKHQTLVWSGDILTITKSLKSVKQLFKKLKELEDASDTEEVKKNLVLKEKKRCIYLNVTTTKKKQLRVEN